MDIPPFPSTFGEVSYFDDEFRGDLVIFNDALYFFPVRRSGYNRVYLFDGPIDRIVNFVTTFGLMLFSGVGLMDIIDFVSNIMRLARRPAQTSLPNSLTKLGFGSAGISPEELQLKMDNYIKQRSQMKSDFSSRSLPKPFVIKKYEIRDVSFNWRLVLRTEYESHDFGISPFRRKVLKIALQKANLLT
jgi:hypothetical protein